MAENNDEILTQAEALYDAGKFISACRLIESQAPLQAWVGASRILPARLMSRLGSDRGADALIWLATREAPDDPLVRYYLARRQLGRKGPVAGWRFMSQSLPAGTDPQIRGEWIGLQSAVLCGFRDFTRADQLYADAEAITPNKRWLHVERSACLRMQDRYDEARELIERVLTEHQNYAPAVMERAHLYVLAGELDAAIALLTGATETVELAGLWQFLDALYQEKGDFAEARRCVDRSRELLPLADRHTKRAIHAQSAALAYLCGDIDQARDLYEQVRQPWAVTLATNLRNAPAGAKRVLLPVSFVRQHHQTCAPATLTAISRFWGRQADHLAVAEQICYDGTPNYSERNWAEKAGYQTREFTVTWDAAVALIDRGIPFTLTTTDITSGHLQAVVGYDERLRTLLVRDPFYPLVREWFVDDALRDHASTGPRGMMMVPRDEAQRLDGVELPDSPLWDHLHTLQIALNAHDRASAERSRLSLRGEAPEHRLTLVAQRSIASYDADPTAQAEVVDRLLERYPDNASLLLHKLWCLRTTGRQAEVLALLESLVIKPKADPAFHAELARELLDDATQRSRVEKLLRHALRYRPGEPESLHTLASAYWNDARRAEAMELFRFAACMSDKDERYARSYFMSAQALRKQTEAMDHLRARFERFAHKSALPTQTLYDATMLIEQRHVGQEALQRAIGLRPDDGDLLLFAARSAAALGRFEQANEFLDRARGKAAEPLHLRTTADVRLYEARPAESLEIWKQIAQREPLAIDAHREIAARLRQTNSLDAAVAYLRGVSDRFPHNLLIRRLYIEWVGELSPADAERSARQAVEMSPSDASMRRELAIALWRQKKHDEALKQLALSEQNEPLAAGLFNIRGDVYLALGDLPRAREQFAAALQQSIDNVYAMKGLVDASPDVQTKRQSLSLIEQQLVKQVVAGDGLLAYQEIASSLLDPDALLSVLQAAHRERPDLSSAATALGRQLLQMGRVDAAKAIADQACGRFPLLPRLWLERAHACRFLEDVPGEIDSLDRARSLAPWWGEAARQLADLYVREGKLDRTIAVLERAVAANPVDPSNHAGIAFALWALNRRDDAIAKIEHAIKLEPNYTWAWNVLSDWTTQQGMPDYAPKLARRHCEQHPGDTLPWINLARYLVGEHNLAERLAALDKALAIDPRHVEAYDLKALLLCSARRMDEAIETTRPKVFADNRPGELRLREAAVEAERANFPRAVELLKELTKENPRNWAAWARLASVLSSSDASEYLHTAQRMTELFPLEAAGWFHLGNARWMKSDHLPASEALKRAMTLEPDFAPAAFGLFDLLLDRNRLDEAAEVLEHINRHFPGEDASSRAALLAARRGQTDHLRPALEQMARSIGGDLEVFEKSIEQFALKVKAKEIDQLFKTAVADPASQPALAGVWIRYLGRRERFRDIFQAIDSLRARPPQFHQALLAAVRFGTNEHKADFLGKLILQYGADLQADNLLWGTVGWSHLTLHGGPEAARWLRGWENRPGVEAWMLTNAALAHLMQSDYAEARRVSQFAAGLSDDAHAQGEHRAMLALHHAIDGDLPAANATLAAARQAKLVGFYEFNALAAETVCQSSNLPAGNTQRAHLLLQRLSEQITTTGENMRISYDIFDRVNDAISARLGTTPFTAPRPTSGEGPRNRSWIWVFIGIVVVSGILGALNRKPTPDRTAPPPNYNYPQPTPPVRPTPVRPTPDPFNPTPAPTRPDPMRPNPTRPVRPGPSNPVPTPSAPRPAFPR